MSERAILYYGEDTFQIRTKIQQIIKKYDVDEFNTTMYDLDETPLSDALTDAMTMPFMSDMKIVVCHNARFLGTEHVKTELKHDTDMLAKYLQHPPDTAVLLISAPVTKIDTKHPLYNLFKKHKIVECQQKSGKDLESWARRQVGNLSMKIDNDALKEFVRRVEHSTGFAYLEMKKLLLYATGRDRIDMETVEAVITKNIEDNIYEITNALLVRDHRKALSIYRDLLYRSEDPLRILNVIIHKYREMLHVRALLDEGKDRQAVQDHYRVSSGRAYYMVRNAQAVRMDKLKEHLEHLETLDHRIKTGRIDKKLALELFILST